MDRFRNTAAPDRGWWETLWPDPDETLRELEIGGGTLADVGCGRGHFTVPASRRVDRVYGVDIDPDPLAILEAELADAGISTVETVEGDARQLPELLPERVDTVLLANAFHGASEPTALARSVRDALVPTGRFVVVNWHDRPPAETTVLGESRGPPAELRMPPKRAIDVVEPVGFAAVRTVELEPYHYGVLFERDEG